MVQEHEGLSLVEQALHAGDQLGGGSRQERGLAGPERHAGQVVGQHHVGADAPRGEPRLGLGVGDLLPPHVGQGIEHVGERGPVEGVAAGEDEHAQHQPTESHRSRRLASGSDTTPLGRSKRIVGRSSRS